MDKKKCSFLAGVLAVACMATGAALINDGVSAKADGTGFEMIGGASIRIADDGKYGIRYTASLGVTSEDAIASTYGADSTFHVMIIPEVYYENYLDELTVGADYYQVLHDELYDEQTNPDPYIATMEAEPFLPSTSQTQLAQGVYHVQGSLTSLQYNNLNRDFIGLAYYQYEEGEGDAAVTKRVYAQLPENGISDLTRDIVNVASKALNAGVYEADSTADGILDGFIRQGINQAKGVAEANKDQSVDETLTAIGIPSETKINDKTETTLNLNLPTGVDIETVWKAAEGQTLLDGEKAKLGTVAPTTYGETSLTATVLGKTYTTAVKSYKSDDWTFDIDEGCDAYYDFVKGTENDDLTSGEFSYYGSMVAPKIENGCLVIDDVNEWSEIVFMNESKLGNYADGQAVYTQMRIKVVNKATGEAHPWDKGNAMLFAFPEKNSFGTLALRTAKSGDYWMEISGEDEEGFKTITWYRPVTDWYHANMGARAENSTETEDVNTYRQTANNFALMLGNGWRKTNGTAEENYNTKLFIDWIKTGTEATKYTGSIGPVATSTTYGGKENTQYVSTTATVEGVDVSALILGTSAPAVALVGANGKVTGGATAGSATITVNSAEGDEIVYGTLGTVDVYSAINSKYDLDMLALAYARGVATTDWGTSAKYMLTQDIDYNGALFLPIASLGSTAAYTAQAIGKQWKEKIFTDETKYGISYADFVKTGLNSGTAFNATIDGNGYAIKNAKLMLDAVLVTTSNSSAYETGAGTAFHTNFIGSMGTSGVLKNIAIENLGVQTIAEAGYNVQNTLPIVGEDITQAEYNTILFNSAGYIKTNMFGMFGVVSGTFENVYAEWKPTSVTVGEYGNNNFAFGRWDGGKMTDCVLVDACKTANTDSNYKSIRFRAGYTTTTDNVILVHANADRVNPVVYDSNPSGTFTAYKGFAELQTAYDENINLFDGYDDTIWVITLENNELTCALKEGIAG